MKKAPFRTPFGFLTVHVSYDPLETEDVWDVLEDDAGTEDVVLETDDETEEADDTDDDRVEETDELLLFFIMPRSILFCTLVSILSIRRLAFSIRRSIFFSIFCSILVCICIRRQCAFSVPFFSLQAATRSCATLF